jgi:hypothetical protein
MNNIFDKMIAKLPDNHVKALDKRYSPLTLEPRKMKFTVASSPTAGRGPTIRLGYRFRSR